jgi:hypothetical protein
MARISHLVGGLRRDCVRRRALSSNRADQSRQFQLAPGISSKVGSCGDRANEPRGPLRRILRAYPVSGRRCALRHRVCTDEIIRSYRAVGIDLQKEVHDDMLRNFAAYPNQRLWGLTHPDSNIDHRRVPNLMVFFGRKGEALAITSRNEDYSPGDLVTWDLGGVHNIGAGPKLEDVLFHWKITGHYRYFGPSSLEH